MEKIDRDIAQRVEWHKAKAHLNCILEYFVGELSAFNDMNQKIEEFVSWVENEGPLEIK
jgi:hypothetical protein